MPKAFTLELPDGWLPVVAQGAIAAASAQNIENAFVPNVVVTWTRFGEVISLEDAATTVLARYSEYIDAEFVGAGEHDLGGVPAWLCEVAFTHPEAGTLVQANTIVVVPMDRGCDVFSVVASCEGSQVEMHFAEVRAVARSIDFQPFV